MLYDGVFFFGHAGNDLMLCVSVVACSSVTLVVPVMSRDVLTRGFEKKVCMRHEIGLAGDILI